MRLKGQHILQQFLWYVQDLSRTRTAPREEGNSPCRQKSKKAWGLSCIFYKLDGPPEEKEAHVYISRPDELRSWDVTPAAEVTMDPGVLLRQLSLWDNADMFSSANHAGSHRSWTEVILGDQSRIGCIWSAVDAGRSRGHYISQRDTGRGRTRISVAIYNAKKMTLMLPPAFPEPRVHCASLIILHFSHCLATNLLTQTRSIFHHEHCPGTPRCCCRRWRCRLLPLPSALHLRLLGPLGVQQLCLVVPDARRAAAPLQRFHGRRALGHWRRYGLLPGQEPRVGLFALHRSDSAWSQPKLSWCHRGPRPQGQQDRQHHQGGGLGAGAAAARRGQEVWLCQCLLLASLPAGSAWGQDEAVRCGAPACGRGRRASGHDGPGPGTADQLVRQEAHGQLQ